MLQSPKRILAILASTLLSLAAVASAAADDLRHTVVAGDTLSGIAYLYGVTVELIASANDIADPNVIYPGQDLVIPGLGNRETAPAAAGGSYTVEEGDTLGAIAAQYGVSLEALRAANGLSDPNVIFPGEALSIPALEPVTGGIYLPETEPDDPYVEGFIEEASVTYGVDPGLAKALAWIESNWQQGAVSSTGAVGVFQIMPETAAFMETDVFGFPLNEDVSINDNVYMGVRILSMLIDASGGDVDSAIASYYQGQGATDAGIMYEDTKGYVAAVTTVWQRFWQ